jgi:hypothetical protein
MKRFYAFFTLFLFACFQLINAQGLVVTGKVTSSEDGLPIPGVAIVVKGTTLGYITDLNGEYSFEIPNDARALMFSFVGMKTQEIPIAGRTRIDVNLEPDVIGIEEVVVTAIGIRRETKALGYAAEAIEGDQISGSGETNIIQSLSKRQVSRSRVHQERPVVLPR